MKIKSTPQLRPSTQKVREALCNIWRGKVAGSKFLDLFAGIGSVGIEALNQGALLVHFVENDAKAFKILHQNLSTTGCSGEYKIFKKEVEAFLKQATGIYDLIFLDPPYNSILASETLELLAQKKLLAPEGWIIAEHHHKTKLAEVYGMLHNCKTYKYGETRLSLYRFLVSSF
jgi:16S rRNA (guanine966-N2)-methyltransferase